MELQDLRPLFAHMEWADAVMWDALLAEETVLADEFAMDSVVHLHLVQRAYLSMWRGEPVERVTRQDFDAPVDIRAWAREYYPTARDFLEQLPSERLAEKIETPWKKFIEDAIGGPLTPATWGDTALQVTMHSLHHRAQINRRIRELGAEPPFIDYIAWAWRGRPDPSWG